MSVTYTYAMPSPYDPKAPRFTDPDVLYALSRYLDTLDREFERAGIVNDADKSKWAIAYVPGNIALYWSSFPGLDTMTWDAFKTELRKAYPNAGIGHKYLYADSNRIETDFAKLGLNSLSDYQEFWQRISVVTANMAVDSQVSEHVADDHVRVAVLASVEPES